MTLTCSVLADVSKERPVLSVDSYGGLGGRKSHRWGSRRALSTHPSGWPPPPRRAEDPRLGKGRVSRTTGTTPTRSVPVRLYLKQNFFALPKN